MTSFREQIDEWANTHGVELIVFDGLDEALMGISRSHPDDYKAVYHGPKILEILQADMECDYGEAWEYFSFNVECLYAGPSTPSIFWPADEL